MDPKEFVEHVQAQLAGTHSHQINGAAGNIGSPALEKLAFQIFLASRKSVTSLHDVNTRAVQDSRSVILVGFGRMGRRVGCIMELMKIPYVAIDSNVSIVEHEHAEGKSVYFGDAQRPEVLRAAGVADALLVIVSIDDFEVTERVVSSLHSAFPDIPVFARGHDLVKCRDLKAQGAHFTVSETLEASAELARAALLHIGVQDKEVELALENFRKDYYGRIDKAVRKE